MTRRDFAKLLGKVVAFTPFIGMLAPAKVDPMFPRAKDCGVPLTMSTSSASIHTCVVRTELPTPTWRSPVTWRQTK
jgi:hypothetical protein